MAPSGLVPPLRLWLHLLHPQDDRSRIAGGAIGLLESYGVGMPFDPHCQPKFRILPVCGSGPDSAVSQRPTWRLTQRRLSSWLAFVAGKPAIRLLLDLQVSYMVGNYRTKNRKPSSFNCFVCLPQGKNEGHTRIEERLVG